MAKIQIVYGSNGGNTALVCEYVQQQLQEQGHQVKLDRCEAFPAEALTKADLLILACPTYEHGALEPNFLKLFWPRIQPIDLQTQACTVIGLGDIKYDIDYHIESARTLQNYVLSHNGKLVHPSLMVSGPPLPLLEKLVKGWCQRLHPKLEPC